MASLPKFQSWNKVSFFILLHSDCAHGVAHSYTLTDHHEHELVLSAMVALEPTRKCFRLVGGVLVERTVAEVHPAVTSNKEKIKSVIESLRCALLFTESPFNFEYCYIIWPVVESFILESTSSQLTRARSLQLAEKERIIREFVGMHKLNVGSSMVTRPP